MPPPPATSKAIAALLEAIARRSTPLGDLLARGMDEALTALGMPEWTITTKRLDPAGYEPRGMKSMAFSYAVGVRGADHLRATFYKAEFAGMLEGLDDDAWVQTYIDFEDRMLLLDSLTMCRFYRDILTWERIPTRGRRAARSARSPSSSWSNSPPRPSPASAASTCSAA